jgi:hypothetical protein
MQNSDIANMSVNRLDLSGNEMTALSPMLFFFCGSH